MNMYTEKFKEQMIELYNCGFSLKELEKVHKVSKSTLKSWIDKWEKEESDRKQRESIIKEYLDGKIKANGEFNKENINKTNNSTSELKHLDSETDKPELVLEDSENTKDEIQTKYNNDTEKYIDQTLSTNNNNNEIDKQESVLKDSEENFNKHYKFIDSDSLEINSNFSETETETEKDLFSLLGDDDNDSDETEDLTERNNEEQEDVDEEIKNLSLRLSDNTEVDDIFSENNENESNNYDYEEPEDYISYEQYFLNELKTKKITISLVRKLSKIEKKIDSLQNKLNKMKQKEKYLINKHNLENIFNMRDELYEKVRDINLNLELKVSALEEKLERAKKWNEICSS